MLCVSAIQLTATQEKDRNLAQADRLVREAAATGAKLIVLPEKWNFVGTPEQLVAAAEPLTGEAINWARTTARECEVDLVAGSITELGSDGERYNTSVHIGPDGEIKDIYRKIHLFDVEVAGRVYRESDSESAGDEIVTGRTATDICFGMSICYDLRFAELYRLQTVRGARVLLVPSAFTLATTRDHWPSLLRARAIENQTFVIAANQIGEHWHGYSSGGRSMIIDPWGIVLTQAADNQTFISCELDFEQQDQIRQRLPALDHRRPDIYHWPASN